LSSSLRSAVAVIARCSLPTLRWNSSGMGGFQTGRMGTVSDDIGRCESTQA
jgi:hypothetical protein